MEGYLTYATYPIPCESPSLVHKFNTSIFVLFQNLRMRIRRVKVLIGDVTHCDTLLNVPRDYFLQIRLALSHQITIIRKISLKIFFICSLFVCEFREQ
jgi:hypothetical protein